MVPDAVMGIGLQWRIVMELEDLRTIGCSSEQCWVSMVSWDQACFMEELWLAITGSGLQSVGCIVGVHRVGLHIIVV